MKKVEKKQRSFMEKILFSFVYIFFSESARKKVIKYFQGDKQ